MSPELYNNLTYVHGFIDKNGKTYQEHITIIFEDNLTNNQKEEILATKEIPNALNLLHIYDIKYTHVYHDDPI